MDWNSLGKRFGHDLFDREPDEHDLGSAYQAIQDVAPREMVTDGVREAFESDQTPPFEEMLAHVFQHADAGEKAGILNQLLAGTGLQNASMLGGLGSLGGLLGGLGATPTIQSQDATHVSAHDAQQIAAAARQNDPSVVARVSEFIAQHPQLVSALGGAALSMIMSRLSHLQDRR